MDPDHPFPPWVRWYGIGQLLLGFGTSSLFFSLYLFYVVGDPDTIPGFVVLLVIVAVIYGIAVSAAVRSDRLRKSASR